MLYDRYRHSAAAGNCWLDSTSAFIWRWGFKNFSKEEKPRMAMGKAAEEAAFAGLAMGLTIRQIARHAQDRFDWYMEGEWAPERSFAVRCAIRAYLILRPYGRPVAHNPWRPVHLIGEMEREISLKPDFLYDGWGVDLKCTTRIPTGRPNANHERQAALYASGYEKPHYVLYVSPVRRPKPKPLKSGPRKGTIPLTKLTEKRTHSWFLIDRQTAASKTSELLTAFRQIERWDNAFDDPKGAVPYAPLNFDSFYWSDPEDAMAAADLWETLAA